MLNTGLIEAKCVNQLAVHREFHALVFGQSPLSRLKSTPPTRAGTKMPLFAHFSPTLKSTPPTRAGTLLDDCLQGHALA